MTTRTIATFVTTVQQNCAWAVALSFVNAEASPVDLTGITLTGHFRTVANPGPPLATATFTTTTPTSGVTVAALSAHDAGLLPAPANAKFNQFQQLVLEIDGAHAADPNNPFRLGEGSVQVSPGGNSTPSAAAAPTVPLDTISLVVGAVNAAAARQLIGVNDNAGLIPVAQLPLATSVSPGAESVAHWTALEYLINAGFTSEAAMTVPFVFANSDLSASDKTAWIPVPRWAKMACISFGCTGAGSPIGVVSVRISNSNTQDVASAETYVTPVSQPAGAAWPLVLDEIETGAAFIALNYARTSGGAGAHWTDDTNVDGTSHPTINFVG
jgi:hypothetical protein